MSESPFSYFRGRQRSTRCCKLSSFIGVLAYKTLQLPSHVRLLLLVARVRTTEAEVSQIEELCASPIDWDAFLTLTEHHRLSPLAFENLDRLRPVGIPDYVREALHMRSIANAMTALRVMGEFRRLKEGFAEIGIEISTLKGVPLSQVLYGNPNTRHVGDLDILTTAESLPEQIAVLSKLGYERVHPKCKLTPRRLSYYVAFRKDFTFRNKDAGFDLDLHWRLFDNRLHAANRIFSGTPGASVQVHGISTRQFVFQDQFLYVASHGVSDAWMYLKSLADVSAFLRILSASELDAALVRATELGVLAHVSAAIHGANEWFGAEIANPRLLSEKQPLSRYLRRRLLNTFLKHNFQPNRTDLTPLDWLMLDTELVPGPSAFLERVGHVIWRPRVWSTVDLPDNFFWAYSLLGLFMPPRRHSEDY
jgi:hypothetical protein